MKRRTSVKLLGLFGVYILTGSKTVEAITNSTCEICRKAWEGLGKFPRTRYQFRYIEPVAKLPKVFIYGDSISIGYTEYVRASLEGIASVYRLHENGSSSNEFIKKMEKFRKTMFQPYLEGGWNFKWDVIHFNVGLHDLKYLSNKKLDKENGTQVTSLELYEANLNKIINYLKINYPKAKLIFATTTLVPDGEPGRIKGDAIRYNDVALKVLKNHKDIIVNNLHLFSIPVWKSHGKGYGDVHYQEEGSRLLGIEVAKVIANILHTKPMECPSAEVIKNKFKIYETSKKK